MAERAATYGEVFRVPEFRALFCAQAFSILGDQLARVALSVLVFHRSGSPLLTALTYALTYLPWALGGPLLSTLADRYPRRTVMLTCDLLRALLVLPMALPQTPIWLLLALVFAAELFTPPFESARAALLPDVLIGDRYVVGSAIGNISMQAGQVLGFLAGGAIVAAVSARLGLLVDAGSFAASALIVWRGVARRPAPAPEGEVRPSLFGSMAEGARIVFGHPTLRALLLLALVGATTTAIPEALAVPYAHALGGGPLEVGLLLAANPVGAVLGGTALARFCSPARRVRLMRPLALLSGAALIPCLTHPGLAVTVGLWVLSGVGLSYQLPANASFMATVREDARGRAFGLAITSINLAIGLGSLLAGVAAQAGAPTVVVGIDGAIGLAGIAVVWVTARGNLAQVSTSVRGHVGDGSARVVA